MGAAHPPRNDQPAMAIMKARRIYGREVAEEAGVSMSTAYQTLYGRCRPNPRVVRACVRMLGLPAADLFRPESLKKPKSPAERKRERLLRELAKLDAEEQGR